MVKSRALNFLNLKQPNCKVGFVANTSKITEMHKFLSKFIGRTVSGGLGEACI